MATFDQLSADQRAIVELVLQRGKSYGELADLLGMPEDRVRELAQGALVTLAPITAEQVESDWRSQIADYVLGQQTGPEATATKGHLRRSEAARAWTRSLLDSLETLYENGLPQVPAGERATRERKPRKPEREERPTDKPARAGLSSAAQDAVRRRRMLGAGGFLAALALAAVLVWPIGVLTGDDDGGGGSSSEQSSTNAQESNRTAGIAVVAQRSKQRQVIVQATLPPNQQRQAYEVWLYNSPTDAKSLGAQVTNAQGTYQGAGPLPSDYARYKFIDVSREPIDRNRSHSKQSILRGRMPKLKQARAGSRQAQILGQAVLRPVSGG
jgi:hypothetical protein